MEKFKLSFDDSAKIESRKGNKTTVVLRPYIKQHLLQSFDETVGSYAWEAMAKHGFKWDPMIGGFAARVKGSVELMDGDTDDQATATRIATTKAKLKCFRLAQNLLDDIASEAINRASKMSAYLNDINRLVDNEEAGLANCIKTGYCDSNR